MTRTATAVARLSADGDLLDVRVSGDGLFPLYSVTKTVIATQVLQLAAAGHLGLTHPVGRWEPDLPGADRITVDHLLTHTSGLPDYGALPDYRRAARRPGSQPWPDEQYLGLASEIGLEFAPGAAWGYSNIGYLVLRRLVATVTGERWADSVRRTVLDPAGLSRTVVLERREDMTSLTPPGLLDYHPAWVPHGVLASTAEEAARLMALCLADTRGLLLPRDGPRHGPLRRLGLPGRPLHPDPAYGRGVMGGIAPVAAGDRRVHVLGHTGGGPGGTAAVYVVRDGAGARVIAALAADEDAEVPEGLVLSLAGERDHVSTRSDHAHR